MMWCIVITKEHLSVVGHVMESVFIDFEGKG